MFNFARVFINDKTIRIQKVIKVHIQVIGNKTRIQFRPGNPYLFTASTTSLTVETHNEPNLFNQRDNGAPQGPNELRKKPSSIFCGWLLAVLKLTGGIDASNSHLILPPIQMMLFLHTVPALRILEILQGILQREAVLPLHGRKYAIELFFYRVVNAVA